LEAVRRGFQDYQYLLLFDQACRQGLISPEHRTQVRSKIERFTGNLPRNSFPVSMGELEAVRLQVGELLDNLEGIQQDAVRWKNEDCSCGNHAQ
jgi:hypothetical protein